MNYDKLCVITFSVLMEWLGNFEKYSYDTGLVVQKMDM